MHYDPALVGDPLLGGLHASLMEQAGADGKGKRPVCSASARSLPSRALATDSSAAVCAASRMARTPALAAWLAACLRRSA